MVRCLETELIRMDYIKSTQKYKNATIFTVYHNEEWYAIALADIMQSHIKSGYSALALKKTISANYHISLDNIVLVLCGSKYGVRDYGKNTLVIDNITGEIKHKHVSSSLSDVLQPVIKYCKKKQCDYKKMAADTKIRYGNVGYTGWLPMMLVLINFVIYLKLLFTGNQMYSISALSVFQNKEYYRLFTYMFSHANIGHIISNSIALLAIGQAYASRAGAVKFLTVYISGGMLAGISSLLYTSIFTNRYAVETVGASGAIFAVLGAYFIECMMDKNMNGKRSGVIKYCVITMILSNIGANIDIACHIGGFIAGISVAYVLATLYELVECEKYIQYAKKKSIC